MNREKRLVLRFLQLPYRHQVSIANALGGLGNKGTDEEEALHFFKRMKAQGALAKLWDETEKYHQDPSKVNPFACAEEETSTELSSVEIVKAILEVDPCCSHITSTRPECIERSGPKDRSVEYHRGQDAWYMKVYSVKGRWGRVYFEPGKLTLDKVRQAVRWELGGEDPEFLEWSESLPLC